MPDDIIMNMNDITTDVVGVAAVMGLVQVAKTVGLSSRFAPLLSLVLGVLYSFATDFSFVGGLKGVFIGLSAAGLYSGTRTIVSN